MHRFMSQYRSDECLDIPEEYYFDVLEDFEDDRVFVLIIYDIIDNKRRVKFAKFLQSYGFRVQKSAFEAMISKNKVAQLTGQIPRYIAKEDSVRLYRITGKGQVTSWGEDTGMDIDEIVVI